MLMTTLLRVLLATVLPSPTGDSAAEMKFIMARYRCQVMLATVLSSHASDGTVKSC
jgi:hypothetical protein